MLKRVFQRHLRTVHPKLAGEQGVSTHQCPQCERSFARSDILDRHQAEQHDGKSTLVECISCGSFIRQRALKDHCETRKCQQMQLNKDITQIRGLTNFNLPPSVSPLLAAGVSSIKQFRCLEQPKLAHLSSQDSNDDFADFLHFRGIALRAVLRALKAPTRSESPGLCLALYALMVPHWRTRFGEKHSGEDQNLILAGAINALQNRFNRELIDRKHWGPSGIVTQLETYLMQLDSGLAPVLFSRSDFWPDILRPRIIAEEPFQRVAKEMAWNDAYGDSGYMY